MSPALRNSFVVLLLVFAAASLSAAISYPPPTFASTGLGPTAIATADFDGDCDTDFATANQFAANVTVRFGDGTGGFPTSATIGGMASPQAIVTADFDHDGSPDLAVGNNSTFPGDPIGPTIAILLNDGSGGFTQIAPSLATSGGARWMATADVNEDGDADLLVSDAFSPTNGVKLYLGDGTGHFGAPTHISTDTHMAGAMVVVDFNGDDDLDLAVVTGDATALFLGNGDGTFGAPAYHLYPDPVVGADGAVHIAAADIDADGDMDFATVAGNVVAGATVFNNDGTATFTRTKFQMPLAPANPIFVALADLDGDGNIDIVSANQSGCTPWGSNLAARPGNGDGTFGASQPISVGYGPTCLDSHWQPNAIAPVDLNCDGAADLIVPNMNTAFASVLLTAGAADTTAPVVTAPPAVSVAAPSGCSAVVPDAQLGTATATDNCSECVTIVRTGVPAGNVFPAGSTIVTYTATDGHGNSASATQTVTVTDGAPPAITAPPDVSVTAGAGCVATVDPGTPAASDACSAVTVSGVRSDAQPLAAPYPVGTTTIVWTATDASGNSASDTQTITVAAPVPVISGASATPPVLWPPNHSMQDVAVSYTVTGGCGGATCTITSVVSDEPIDGLGDGDMAPDWEIVDEHHVRLRAERAGGGDGRVYTITITCGDSGGNTATTTVTVTVPKSQK